MVPKPSVAPCTLPNTSETDATPATMPVATGTMAAASARSDANVISSRPPISTVPVSASARVSAWICARLSTANFGAPLTCRSSPEVATVAKAARNVTRVCACASRSLPSAWL